jgi:hypothetical protein
VEQGRFHPGAVVRVRNWRVSSLVRRHDSTPADGCGAPAANGGAQPQWQSHRQLAVAAAALRLGVHSREASLHHRGPGRCNTLSFRKLDFIKYISNH